MAELRAYPELFENAFEGVNTAVSPEMISRNQLQWGKNVVNRGAKPTTRPPFIYRMSLPSGLVQGASYFGVQGGMGVASIAGNMWRLRIGPSAYSAEQIVLPWRNSALIKKVYMQQTVETLVIQDGQSNPILYDGSTAERSNPTAGGVPRGTVMAYGNGRLWVAINSKELVAGDIRTNTAGSELQFTETNYLSGGGTLYFPRGITALGFIATTGTSDYGALLVFGLDYTESVRADITFRDLWAQTPGFVTNVLRHTGCASHWSLAEVNQDLYWRDAGGGIRSIRSSLADENGPGNAPISREISRLTDYDSPQLLGFCSAISFNNRLIVTSSPYLNEEHGVSWKDLAPLDFAPMSTMRGKSLPAYDGEWDGLNFTHLFQGQFNGRSRAFGIASNPDGTNALWELMEDGRGGLDDVTVSCSDGSSTTTLSPITCMLESGARSAGDAKIRKRAERCDVFISDMLGQVNLKVYWRVDNNQKWLLWDEGVDLCAKNGDPEVPGATTHTWRNILSQQRPQIKTFTVPTSIDPITAFALQTGFEFQVRLVWTGRLKIDKFILWLHRLDESPYAIRDVVVATCLTNDVSGNEIVYQIPFAPCPPPPAEPPIFEQYDGPFVIQFLTQSVEGETRVLYSFAFTGVDHSHAAGVFPPLVSTTNGVIASQWSGESTYDPNTDTYDGLITVVRTQGGTIPNGVNYYAPAAPVLTRTGTDFDDMLFGLYTDGGFSFAARSYTEGYDSEGNFVRKWFSETPGPAVGGYFSGYTMYAIWSDGFTLTVTESNQTTPETLGIPIARTGTPAECQLVTSYDPETKTYTGTKSRVRQNVDIPTGRTKLYGDFVFLVTPEDGSTPYNYYLSQEWDVLGGTTYNAVTWFPWIAEATVCYASGEFSFVPSYFLGYSQVVSGVEYTQLPGSATWPELVVYGMPPRNGGAYDSFQDYGGADSPATDAVVTLFTGYGWAGEWFFNGTSHTTVYDNFESYADGPISRWTQGYGWVSAGWFLQKPRPFVSDSFDSYADGPITSWNVYAPYWGGDGWFLQ